MLSGAAASLEADAWVSIVESAIDALLVGTEPALAGGDASTKAAYAGVVTVLLEAAKNDTDVEALSELLVDAQLSSVATDVLVDTFAVSGSSLLYSLLFLAPEFCFAKAPFQQAATQTTEPPNRRSLSECVCACVSLCTMWGACSN
jgi:hypothetical protein